VEREEDTAKGRRHDITTRGEDPRSIGDWEGMTKVLHISTSNKSTHSTRVKKNMRRRRAVYSKKKIKTEIIGAIGYI
jgi:hypothetical protein